MCAFCNVNFQRELFSVFSDFVKGKRLSNESPLLKTLDY